VPPTIAPLAQTPPQPSPTTSAPSASAAPPVTAQATATAQADGFRSAHWGMTETEVKAAIKKDFDLGPDKIRAQRNLAERTSILAISAPNIIEGAGTAEVLYIFGYQSKRLIQVNLQWGIAVDQHVDDAGVVAAANQLRDYFLAAGYDPKTITANLRLADGSVIAFRGQDAQKHTVLVRLISVPNPTKRNAAPREPQVALFLSYIADAENPDIFRLPKGQF
jgi:hypothetical protein